MRRRDFITLSSLAVPGFMLLDKLEGLGMVTNLADRSDVFSNLFRNANGPRPYTLWQWMDGCVTREGITYDLEAFKKAGINDVQQFLIGGSETDISDPLVNIMGEEWTALMRFALDECERLGMTFGTHNCPGWSSSGAPGLQPEDSMQKLVWTKTLVTGKDSLKMVIPRVEPDPKWNYYKDICVIAFPAGSDAVNLDTIQVLQGQLTTDNLLKKKLPKGDWTILRFGHTTVGKVNGTAPISGQGLEVDKMSKTALEKFWALYPAKLIEIADHHTGKTFKRFEIDSYEAGEQTWTLKMATEFKERQGYDLLPWLPVLAGFTINGKEASGRFNYDWQQTINILFAENYYGHLHTLINNAGMEFLIQPYGTGHANFDMSSIRGIGDILMCEFWWGSTWGWDSIMPVASNAHVNGKKLVAAEAFTGQPQFAWKVDLFDLKPVGDRAFCNGVNLLVFHASAQQPWPHIKPGMTMGWWGTQFGPSQTWWDHGAPEWIQYLNRCQLILQKGLFVADVCFLALHRQKDPVAPAGYKADFCNEKEFTERFNATANGWLLPDGMHYKIIVLPDECAINLTLARKIETLVNKGGVILGKGFKGTPGLKNTPDNDEVLRISTSLFSVATMQSEYAKQKRQVGQGRVYTGYSVQEALLMENIPEDVALPDGEKDILWIHRQDNDEHYYFVSNQSITAKGIHINFRIKGMQPELWDAETGIMIKAPVWETDKDRIKVFVNLEAYGSVFIVFKESTSGTNGLTMLTINNQYVNPVKQLIMLKDGKQMLRLNKQGTYKLHSGRFKVFEKVQKNEIEQKKFSNNWQVTFQEEMGAPVGPVVFDKLISYTDHKINGIKYFSGKAHYSNSFNLKTADIAASKIVFLELGVVKNVATILINGNKVKTLWKPPFSLDISSFCKAGNNTIEVEVTNLWPNRMIGDEHEPDDLKWGDVRYFKHNDPKSKIGRNLQEVPNWVKQNKERPSKNRVTFSVIDFFDKDDPLLSSGLLGPVTISIEDVVKL